MSTTDTSAHTRRTTDTSATGASTTDAGANTASAPAPDPCLARAHANLAGTYVRPDVLFVAGEGAWLVDSTGVRHLDMTSGIAVTALGHGGIREPLRAAAEGLVHTSNLYHTQPPIELATALVERSFASRVFFANSGAEANEAAIKFARLRGGPQRREILYAGGAFHGRTMGALAATDRPDHREPFTPLPGGYARLPWNDASALDRLSPATAAVMLEPVQGESGIRPADPEWLAAIRRRCDDVGALLVFDEVQCGLGRTGALWAHEQLGVTPDVMTLAKPLAGGLPIGATLLGPRVADSVTPGMHGSTFGGGPLVTSVALFVLRTVADETFLEDVRRKGRRLRRALSEIHSPLVRDVRGLGLMIGVETERSTDVLAAALAERLLVVPTGGDVIRFLPPLNVSDAEIDEAVTRFSSALERVADTSDTPRGAS